jgi:hypothetical protein
MGIYSKGFHKKTARGPWATCEEWSQVRLSFLQVEKAAPEQCRRLKKTARSIQEQYERLADVTDLICAQTCVTCMDICCIRAHLWFDFIDLLYLYFDGHEFPESQMYKITIDKTSKTKIHHLKNNNQKSRLKKEPAMCCYLTPSGCRLERTIRPFVCTWYVCPTQKKYLQLHGRSGIKKRIDQGLEKLKHHRAALEQQFIDTAIRRM